VGAEHRETDLGGAAAVTDRGQRHRRNEDSYAIAAEGARTAVVVCDGVSSSANPDQASSAAAVAAIEVLLPALKGPAPAAGEEGNAAITGLLHAAIAAARQAVVGVPESEPGGYPAAPSTTIVAALVEPGRVAVASVGDSRAYWLAPADEVSRRLTVDDSLAEMAIAQGVPPETAYRLPQAHVITRWLGAGVGGSDPEVGVFTTGVDGLLLVCTDGLWNYFEPSERLASLVSESDATTPVEIARLLVGAANAAGGTDNITVAVVAVPPDQGS
jgi:serine/threonine protein phosphatase PrpC